MKHLSAQLMAAFGAVTLLAVLVVAALVDWSANQAFLGYLAREQEFAQSGQVQTLTTYYQQNGSWEGITRVLSTPLGGGMGGGMGAGRHNRPALLLADASGLILYDERGARTDQPLTEAEQARAQHITVQGATVGYWLFQPPPGGPALTLSQQNFLNQLRWNMAGAALAAVLVSMALGWWLSHSLTGPLARTAQAARALAAKDWHARAPEHGTAEIAAVGRAFNAMASALQAAEKQRQQLMADIAHDLRTPLTVLQGNLRALLDGVYPLEPREIATLYDETRLLSRLVDDVHELALADAGHLSLHLGQVNLAETLTRVVDPLRVAAEAHAVAVQSNFPASPVWVHADPDRLAQVARNLLTNALHHTPAGGCITVSVQVQPTGAEFRVQDTGPGIDPADLPHVFERFYRADKARTRHAGSGLGLAIAHSWVTAMHGDIGVTSPPGAGACFWVRLPLAAPAEAAL